MNTALEFKILLAQVDAVLDQCRPDETAPQRPDQETLAQRVRLRPLLDQADEFLTEGLRTFPCNAQLLRRRAWARAQMVSPTGDRPGMAQAVEDLQLLLESDPYDLTSTAELLENMDTVNGMPKWTVAQVAAEFAGRAEGLLLRYRVLQIRALIDTGDHPAAREVHDHATRQFPDSTTLRGLGNEIRAPE